ncbi:FAD-dependent oxidoreductase, partial [Saccharomonospora iraqiensis]|uniref:FAD-dependent oxidoreductase n=1 Tax=Saccharomonospora iraqiensis TaxID=52698 RepID=UPI00022E0056
MAFAITQTCCNDASCVTVCPVNCIHPTPDEPDFGSTEMLYIDPASCIDCGACADACPVDAIVPVDVLSGPMTAYAELNAAYYADRGADRGADRDPVAEAADPAPNFHPWSPPVFARDVPSDMAPLDVAVVGTGPAGMYAVEDLLLHTNARVTLIDRLSAPGGLVRYGVAPDHPSTKKIGETFARFHKHPRLRLKLGVEVGTDVTVDDLSARHDAVLYAVGASAARALGIEGEDLPGSVAATTVVGWYNGHPDVPADAVDLSAERVAVVGNGNVALDVARILTADPDELAHTPIAPHALRRLRSSRVREVVLLGRRGPESAAFTRPELLALTEDPDRDVVVDAGDHRTVAALDDAAPTDKAGLLRSVPREVVDWSAPPAAGMRRIVFRFHSAPRRITGPDRVRGLWVTGPDDDVAMSVGRVVRAVGHRGTAVPGLP